MLLLSQVITYKLSVARFNLKLTNCIQFEYCLPLNNNYSNGQPPRSLTLPPRSLTSCEKSLNNDSWMFLFIFQLLFRCKFLYLLSNKKKKK